MQDLSNISKFLSYILRHKPETIGLELDAEGWASVSDILSKSKCNGHRLTSEIIKTVVATSDKKRFALSNDGKLIRAVQGHSTSQVNINFTEVTPPDVLYHGTASRFIESIKSEGLRPQQRQYVHLSADETTAFAVGKRYGKPVILTINAKAMYASGLKFYRAENGVWLTAHVPIEFIFDFK